MLLLLVCAVAGLLWLVLWVCCLIAHTDRFTKHENPRQLVPLFPIHETTEDAEPVSGSLPLFYGSDLTGDDARNLIIGLCTLHGCTDNFVKLLLTLLAGTILPRDNTLTIPEEIPSLYINCGAKEFYVNCRGHLQFKRRKCKIKLGSSLHQEQ